VLRPVRGMIVVAFGACPAHALYFSCYELIKRKRLKKSLFLHLNIAVSY